MKYNAIQNLDGIVSFLEFEASKHKFRVDFTVDFTRDFIFIIGMRIIIASISIVCGLTFQHYRYCKKLELIRNSNNSLQTAREILSEEFKVCQSVYYYDPEKLKECADKYQKLFDVRGDVLKKNTQSSWLFKQWRDLRFSI